MSDLFGHVAERPAFVDIRNQRPSAAEEKARLCMELNRMLQVGPKSLGTMSIQQVREFKHQHKLALKVLRSKTSSRQELLTQINRMRSFDGLPDFTLPQAEAA